MNRYQAYSFQAGRGGVLCFAILFVFVLGGTAAGADFASVRKDGVNIRSGPGTDKEILWEVFGGFPLQVVERRDKWAHIKDFEGDQGWIYAPLLSRKQTVIVRVDTANMRSGPGKDHGIIATVKYGVVFTPLKREGDWVKVRHEDGTGGWIYAELLWPDSLP